MLSLERFAEVRAAIERTGDRDAALAQAGLEAREWLRLQRHWLRELAEEIANGGAELAARYCRAFTGASEPSPAGSPAATAAPAPAGPLHVPSYLAAVPSPAPPPLATAAAPPPAPLPSAAAVPFTGTAMVFELPRGPAMPFREGPPAAVAPAPAPPTPSAPPARSGETAMVFELPRGPATPFPGPASPRRPPSPAPSESALPVSESGTVLDIGLTLAGPSTPFTAPEAGPFGFTVQGYAELIAACQEPGAAREQVLARFGLDAVSFADLDGAWKAKLRAEAGLTLEFHRRLAEETRALAERRREAAERPKRAGATVAIPVHSSSSASPPPASPGAAIPLPAAGVSQPAPTAHVPDLTVEQYAWVVATLRRAASPADLEQALARFRLTAETRKLLEERWRTRMAADPALQARFVALLAGHLRSPGA